MNSEAHQKGCPENLERSAFLYVRQSTVRQVQENIESTKRQYGLRDRALALGWSADQITIIDCDQGQSGSSIAGREGFQRLVTEVSMNRAGIVMGLEVSRLARNSSDWHRLLEICALTQTLLLDEEAVYDPSYFNDRLLLGLKGTMSEVELHVIRARLRGGLLHKARRGELGGRLASGLVYGVNGQVELDPDQQVQQSFRHLFTTFHRTGSALAVVKAFAQEGLKFPRRVWGGTEVVAILPISFYRPNGVLRTVFFARIAVRAKMWNALFAIVFYTAAGLALVAAATWYGRSLYDALPGHGGVVIAAFDIVGSTDTDKSRGVALANMLQARLGEIENDLEAAQNQLMKSRREPGAAQSPTASTDNGNEMSQSDAHVRYSAALPKLWGEDAIELKTGLFQPANINATVGGVEVGGIVAWVQRSLTNPRTLKFTVYEKKGLAQVSGSLKPLGIPDDALRLDIPSEGKDTEAVPLDKIVNRLALEIMRRWMARDPQNRIEVLNTDEFGTFVDVLKDAARYNRIVALGRPAYQEFKDLVGKVEPLALAVPDWYQLNYLAASIAESADRLDLQTEDFVEKAVKYYKRVVKLLKAEEKKMTGQEKKKQGTLLPIVEAKIKKLELRLATLVTEKIGNEEEFAVTYFNQLLKLSLEVPPLQLREENNPKAFWNGATYIAAPGVQHIPDMTYHFVSLQYLKKMTGWPGEVLDANSEASAILYAYSDILAVMAKQNRLCDTAFQSANWVIWEGFPAWMRGDDPTADQTPIGSFKAPGTAYYGDQQVAHMRNFKRQGAYAIPQVNCGIFNKAFYETAKVLGNTNRAAEIWIEALKRVENAKELTAPKFAGLLEDAGGADEPKIREALAVVGL